MTYFFVFSFLLFALALILAASISIFFLFYAVVWGRLKGAPYVPSTYARVQTMLKLAEIKPREIIYDLGSGNGILLFEAAKLGGEVRGVEINPFLVWYTVYMQK